MGSVLEDTRRTTSRHRSRREEWGRLGVLILSPLCLLRLRANDKAECVEPVGGDMFESVPSGVAIFMKCILHDWSDEHCLKVLRNCWKALPVTGKVIIMECILPLAPEATKEAQAMFRSDVDMHAHTPGGKERTEADFESLAREAGFAGFEKVCRSVDSWIMEFTK